MPRARSVKEECTIRTHKEAWKTEWSKCLRTECRNRGSQDHHQLDPEEMAGRTSLLKRVSEGELHITPSDKGKGIVVMDMDTYLTMSLVHTKEDKEIEWTELEESQRELRAHSRALANIFNLGEGLGDRNQTRCYDNIFSWACDLPIMRCLPKTHKPLGPSGPPKSRPVV